MLGLVDRYWFPNHFTISLSNAAGIEGMATVTDEIIDLHDRILGKLFNAAKNKHQQQFQASGKAINAKVRLYGRIGLALIDAKQSGPTPPCAATRQRWQIG